MRTVELRKSPSGPVVELEIPELVTVATTVDIPQLAANQVVQLDITGTNITDAGFLPTAGLIANPPDGLSSAIIQGECYVQPDGTLKLKIRNVTAFQQGPFTATPYIFTQVR